MLQCTVLRNILDSLGIYIRAQGVFLMYSSVSQINWLLCKLPYLKRAIIWTLSCICHGIVWLCDEGSDDAMHERWTLDGGGCDFRSLSLPSQCYRCRDAA